MSKIQRHISYLQDETGRMVNFERWSQKNVNVIERNLMQLYSSESAYAFLYRKDILKSKYLTIYATDKSGVNEIEVRRILIEDRLPLAGVTKFAYYIYNMRDDLANELVLKGYIPTEEDFKVIADADRRAELKIHFMNIARQVQYCQVKFEEDINKISMTEQEKKTPDKDAPEISCDMEM